MNPTLIVSPFLPSFAVRLLRGEIQIVDILRDRHDLRREIVSLRLNRDDVGLSRCHFVEMVIAERRRPRRSGFAQTNR